MIPPGAKSNFETLKRAFALGDVALLECEDLVTGDTVDCICAAVFTDGEWHLTPFAMMIRDNPFDRYRPPEVQLW